MKRRGRKKGSPIDTLTQTTWSGIYTHRHLPEDDQDQSGSSRVWSLASVTHGSSKEHTTLTCILSARISPDQPVVCISAMCRVYAIVVAALLAVPHCCRAVEGVGDTLMKMFRIQTIENHTDVQIPSYMYELYEDTGNRQYDVIRSISPTKESLGSYSQFVYDLSTLEPSEIVQKAVLQLEPNTNHQFSKAINVSFFALPKQTVSKTYLGSGTIHGTLNLVNTLGSQTLNDFDQLVIQMEGAVKLSIGLVLYSITTSGEYAKGNELANLLFETSVKRRKRSVADNEIDIKRKNFTDEPKRKKKKQKNSRSNKLQAVDTGDTITFTGMDQCRMEKLVLNFADIGWEDWVIYPKGFETNYCAGGCLFPLGKGSKPTNHATVQSLARSFGRLWDLPEPSCVPDTLAPLTLLYMDRSNHVLLKSYPDMRVITCSCK
uniref:Bone morphogenetic protein 3 n=1 Tax=Schizaphis graminum TaxID=13262 RepID=A0A2S2P371_SCHGA